MPPPRGRDLTDPEAGSHAIQMLVDLGVDALANEWRRDVRGPRVVPLAENHERLRYPPADVTRDARYTVTSMTATCCAAMPLP